MADQAVTFVLPRPKPGEPYSLMFRQFPQGTAFSLTDHDYHTTPPYSEAKVSVGFDDGKNLYDYGFCMFRESNEVPDVAQGWEPWESYVNSSDGILYHVYQAPSKPHKGN